MSETGLSGPLPSASTLVSSSQSGPLAPISLPPLSLPPQNNHNKLDGGSISLPSPRQGISSVPHSPYPSPNVQSPLVNQPIASPGGQQMQQNLHHHQQQLQHHTKQPKNAMPPPTTQHQQIQQQMQHHQIQQNAPSVPVSQNSIPNQNSIPQMNGPSQHGQSQMLQQGQQQIMQPGQQQMLQQGQPQIMQPGQQIVQPGPGSQQMMQQNQQQMVQQVQQIVQQQQANAAAQQITHQPVTTVRRRNHAQQQSHQRQRAPTQYAVQMQTGKAAPHQFVERQVRGNGPSSSSQFSQSAPATQSQQLQQMLRQHHANEAQLQQQQLQQQQQQNQQLSQQPQHQQPSSSQSVPSQPSSNAPSPHPGTPFQDRASPNVQVQPQLSQHQNQLPNSQPLSNGPQQIQQGLPVQMARPGSHMNATRSIQHRSQVVHLPPQHGQPQSSLQHVLNSSPAKPLPVATHRITNQQGQQVLVSATHANMPVRSVLQQQVLIQQQQQQQQQQNQHHGVPLPGPSHAPPQPQPRTQALSALFVAEDGAQMTAKEQYRMMKKNFKFLVYENECYQAELRTLQKKLLKLSRDKNFLLDRLIGHEKMSDSSDENDSDASVKTTTDDRPKIKRKSRPNRKRAAVQQNPLPGQQPHGSGQPVTKKIGGGIHQMLSQHAQHQQALLQQRSNNQQPGPSSSQSPQQNHVQVQRGQQFVSNQPGPSGMQQPLPGPSEIRVHSGPVPSELRGQPGANYPGPSHSTHQGMPSHSSPTNQLPQVRQSSMQQSPQGPTVQQHLQHVQVGQPGQSSMGVMRVKVDPASQQGVPFEHRQVKMEYQNGPSLPNGPNGPLPEGQRISIVPNGSDGPQQFVRPQIQHQQVPRRSPAGQPHLSTMTVPTSSPQPIQQTVKEESIKQESSDSQALPSSQTSPQSTQVNGTRDSQPPPPQGKLD